ncbi:MAG: hypothetical protein WA395_03490, partial [Nitrososphaeraceae archaeon]
SFWIHISFTNNRYSITTPFFFVYYIKPCSDFYMDSPPDRSVTHVCKLICHLWLEVQQLG